MVRGSIFSLDKDEKTRYGVNNILSNILTVFRTSAYFFKMVNGLKIEIMASV